MTQLEVKISKTLTRIGVPSAQRGYDYLRTAVETVYNDPEMKHYITTKLYSAVAIRHKTTPSRAERVIRHSIESAWFRGDYEVLDEIFGGSVSPNKGKPTNGDFVARIADFIREQEVEQGASPAVTLAQLSSADIDAIIAQLLRMRTTA